MRDRQSVALAPQPAVWPPDDTEESVVGTNLHQTAIINLRLGINEAAALATPTGSRAPWQAGDQTMITGFRRPDGSAYSTLPDVFVYHQPFDDERGSLTIAADGPPALIIEVLSDATYRSDLNLKEGKGYSYARAGVREYLILDPTGAYLADQGQGWRLEGNAYRRWRRDAAGRWSSAELPVAFAVEGARTAVYVVDGRRLLREGEIERAFQEQERRRVQEFALLDQQRRAELESLERLHAEEVARLRRRLEALERGE